MRHWNIDVRRGPGYLTARPADAVFIPQTSVVCHGGAYAGALFHRLENSTWALVPLSGQPGDDGVPLLTTDGAACAATSEVYRVHHRRLEPGIYACFTDVVTFAGFTPSDPAVVTRPVLFEVFNDDRAPCEIAEGRFQPPSESWWRTTRRLYPTRRAPEPANQYRYTFEPDRPQE